MEIVVSNKASRPLYEQIVSQIKTQIMSGELKAGEALPSIRSLAKSPQISVLTVHFALHTACLSFFVYGGRGVLFAMQSAVLSVLPEWFYPIRGRKILITAFPVLFADEAARIVSWLSPPPTIRRFFMYFKNNHLLWTHQ